MNQFIGRWYFDLISPFSYLHLKQFHKLPGDLEIECVPVLFAGLLKHWEHKGPAEIPGKRTFMYRQLNWLAGHHGIPFKMPPAHPFNPLPALRLLIASGPTREHVEAAFDMIWKEGRDVTTPESLAELGERLGVKDVQAALADEAVKARLKANTDTAITRGIFGVPTFGIGETLFWGQDSLEMMLDYLKDPKLFDTPEMRRLSSLPVGAARREVSRS
ncbi:MAG TPA: 2-hydroxychromene-2-carboxylate isomerase [Gammaproteobacteria bacterium]|nr:2-hydroxychromene-2-carboxylate isomerase [Gammaproteobacteria bacterium]